MSTWAYTPSGSKFGDRVEAMKPVMYEKGLQNLWNELKTFALRAFGGNVTMSGGRTQFAELDFAVTGDVTTVIPKKFADPMGTGSWTRQMPGYVAGTVESIIWGGFV